MTEEVLEFNNLNLKISLPYNHDLKILELVEKYRKHIYSLYLPIPKRFMYSGDVTQDIDWQNYEEIEIFELAKNLKEWGIELSFLFNITTYYDLTIYQNFHQTELYQFMKRLLNVGLNRFVVADISLAKLIKEHFKEINLEVSLNAFVDSVKKAIFWVDEVDPDTICIAEDCNKDLELIKDIKQVTGKKIKILVNSRCQNSCPNALCHANLLSQGVPVSPYQCGTAAGRKPWLWYSANAVVPYNLRYYKGNIDYIKILGRTQPTYILERDLQLYIDNCNSRAYSLNHGIISENYRHYDDLGKFIIRKIPHPYLKDEPENVFKKVTTCKRNCQICNWCFETWRKDWDIKEEVNPIDGIKYKYQDNY